MVDCCDALLKLIQRPTMALYKTEDKESCIVYELMKWGEDNFKKLWKNPDEVCDSESRSLTKIVFESYDLDIWRLAVKWTGDEDFWKKSHQKGGVDTPLLELISAIGAYEDQDFSTEIDKPGQLNRGLRYFLESGLFDLNVKDEDEQTTALFRVGFDPEKIGDLLELGADPLITNGQGQTIMHLMESIRESAKTQDVDFDNPLLIKVDLCITRIIAHMMKGD